MNYNRFDGIMVFDNVRTGHQSGKNGKGPMVLCAMRCVDELGRRDAIIFSCPADAIEPLTKIAGALEYVASPDGIVQECLNLAREGSKGSLIIPPLGVKF